MSESNKVRSLKLKNGLDIPIIGLGTSLRGKTPGVSTEEFIKSVIHAIKSGYRHIDTVIYLKNDF